MIKKGDMVYLKKEPCIEMVVLEVDKKSDTAFCFCRVGIRRDRESFRESIQMWGCSRLNDVHVRPIIYKEYMDNQESIEKYLNRYSHNDFWVVSSKKEIDKRTTISDCYIDDNFNLNFVSDWRENYRRCLGVAVTASLKDLSKDTTSNLDNFKAVSDSPSVSNGLDKYSDRELIDEVIRRLERREKDV